jgi:hypothetical protein
MVRAPVVAPETTQKCWQWRALVGGKNLIKQIITTSSDWKQVSVILY